MNRSHASREGQGAFEAPALSQSPSRSTRFFPCDIDAETSQPVPGKKDMVRTPRAVFCSATQRPRACSRPFSPARFP